MITINKIRSIFSLILFFFSSLIIAQAPSNNFYVKGQIIEAKSELLLEYVNVVVYSMRDSSIVSGIISDKNGYFNIKLNKPGKFYVTADFMGYEKTIVENVFINSENKTINIGAIELKPLSVGIDEIEVHSERPFVSYNLDRKVVDVGRNPSAQGGTAVDALENVPSIDIDVEGNVSVRGSTDFTVLIDGRQSPLSGSDALNQIPVSAIDQIEIITNPSVKYDPDGTAGIINIILKKGKLQGHSMVANASLGNSPLRSADVTYSYRNTKSVYMFSAGFRDSEMSYINNDERETIVIDDITNDTSNSFIYTNRDGLRRRGGYYFKGGVDYHLSEWNTITIGGNYYKNLYGRDFNSKIHNIKSDNSSSYEYSMKNFEVRPETWQLNIGDKHIFKENKDHYLTVDLMYQWKDKNIIDSLSKYNSDYLWNVEEDLLLKHEKAFTNEIANRIRIEVDYSVPISENLALEMGYTMRGDSYVQDYHKFTHEVVSSDSVINTEYIDTAIFNRNIHAGWFVTKGKLLGIQYSAGLRFESTNRKIETVKENWNYEYIYPGLYPSLSLAKEWDNGNILQASYSKRIRRPRGHHLNPFPGLSDGYTQYRPNPELQPEYASSYELNFQKTWGQSFIAVETFYRNTVNKMDRITEVEGDTLIHTIINLGSESDAGGELSLNIKLAKWWTFNPMATASYNSAEGTIANDYRTASSMNYRASLNNNFFLPTKTRIQLMSYYRGARIEIDGTREPTYWVSATVRQDFFDRKLSITLRADDIFGTRKRDSYTYTELTTIHRTSQRKSPIMVFSISYKINPAKDKKRSGSNGNGDDVDMGF